MDGERSTPPAESVHSHSHAIGPARLVAALTDAGWVEVGRRTGEYIRFKAPNEWRNESLIVSLDTTARSTTR